MKQTTITRMTLAVIMGGSLLFAACKSNNETASEGSATVESIDTAPVAAAPPYQNPNNGSWQNNNMIQDNDIANRPEDNSTTTTDNSYTNGTRTTATRAKTHRKVSGTAYYRSKTYTGNRTAVSTTPSIPLLNAPLQPENTTAAMDADSRPLDEDESIVDVEKNRDMPAVETQNDYFGMVNKDNTATTKTKVSRFYWAPEVGVNLNNMYMSGNPRFSYTPRAGFNAGAVFNFGVSDHIAVQPGVRYSMKGGEIKSEYSNPSTMVKRDDKIALHYLELPVNIVYNSKTQGKGRVMVGVGGYIAYLADATDKYNATTSSVDGTSAVSGKKDLTIGTRNSGNLSNYDAGIGAFAGYQFSKNLYLKAEAQDGLIDIQKYNNAQGNLNDRNYNLQLVAGYVLGNKK